MKRYLVTSKIAIGALLLLASGPRLVAADDLPKAETILDKSVELTGGKAAYQKIHTEVATGSMEIGPMKGALTVYRAEPDKNYMEIELQGIGKITRGSNGTIAWANSAMQGPQIMDGEEKDAALREGKFDAEVNWRDQYPKVETVGSETVEGKDCYKVVLTPKTGKPVTRYYDKQTGLMQKTVMTVKSAMGEITAETVASDYRKDGDILSPHKLINRASGQEFVITFDKVEYNTEIPPAKFELPTEIQALLNKDKK